MHGIYIFKWHFQWSKFGVFKILLAISGDKSNCCMSKASAVKALMTSSCVWPYFQPAAEMLGSQYQVTSPKLHHSIYSLTDSSDIGPEDEEANAPLRLTPLEKLTTDMCKDETTIKELIIGRRVGFYKVRGEIGCGTFSRVKMAFHALTKGRCTCCQTVQGQLSTSNSSPFTPLL